MSKVRSEWADPLSVAHEILRGHPRFRTLRYCHYWRTLTVAEYDRTGCASWWPLVAHELEDAIRLHIHRTRRTWASDRLVTRVLQALEFALRTREAA
jgi:hypothetical protein